MARPKGEDRGIYEKVKGSDVWWVEHTDKNGKRRREKGGTKSQAKALYQVRQVEKMEGKLPSSLRPRITLAQLVDRYAEENKMAKKSWQGDLVHAAAWIAALGTEDIREVKPGDIEAAKGRWLSGTKDEKPLKPGTVNRRVAYLKTLFGRALRDGLVERSPLGEKRVKMLPEAPPRDRIISPEEEAQIVEHWADNPMMRRAFLVGLYTGLRQAEQFGGRRKDVDFPKGLLRIPDPKGGKGRPDYLPLSPRALELFREQLASHKSPWVWPSDGYGDEDRALSGDTAYERLTAAARQLGLTGIIWHTLRHTFISRLVMLGVPLPTVQKLSRHKSLAMVLRYSHLCPDHTRQALVSLDGFSSNSAKPGPPPGPPPESPPKNGMA